MTDFAYKPLDTDEELAALSAILSNCFGGTPEDLRERVPVVGKENIRLLTQGSEVVGGLWRIPMGQFFTGRSIPMTGVAAVGIQPQSRGRGSAHTLMSECVRECHAKQIALSGLYPATNVLYRRSGYGVAGVWGRMEADAKRLPFLERSAPVFPLNEKDHHEEIQRVYRDFARHREGYLDRGSYIWERIYNPRGMNTQAFGAEHDGKLAAYIFIGQKETDTGRNLYALDFAYTHPQAGERMLTLLAQHKTMASKAYWYGGLNHPTATLYPERIHSYELRSYWMIRLTHIAEALSRRAYPAGLEQEIVLDIADDVIPEQAGPWTLTLSGGRGQARPGGGGGARIDVRELASLYAGFLSAPQLAADGRLSASPEAVEALHRAFPPGAPAMNEMF